MGSNTQQQLAVVRSALESLISTEFNETVASLVLEAEKPLRAARRILTKECEPAETRCSRDTDGDGDCHLCAKKGGCVANGGPY